MKEFVGAAMLAWAVTGGVELRWDAAEACPDGTAGARMIEHHLGHALGTTAIDEARFEVQLEPLVSEGRWRLRLRTQIDGDIGERSLDGPECAPLADAAALMIAMALTEHAQRTASTVDEEQTRPAVSTTPPPEEHPPIETPDPTPTEPRLAGSLGLGAAGELGILPGPHAGFDLTGAVDGRRWRAFLGGRYWLDRRLEVGPGAVTFMRWTLLAGGCGRWPLGPRLRALLCGGVELGQIRARASGIPAATRAGPPWAGLLAGPRLAIAPHRVVAIIAGLDGLLALARPVFLIDGVGRVHRPSAVSARLLLGVEFHFVTG